MSHYTATAIAAALLLSITGCHTTDNHSSSTGTHRMGTPKENYQMSNENMPNSKASGRPVSKTNTEGSGTHRMGTPKENYQMSNENMPKRQ